MTLLNLNREDWVEMIPYLPYITGYNKIRQMINCKNEENIPYILELINRGRIVDEYGIFQQNAKVKLLNAEVEEYENLLEWYLWNH